MFESAWLFPAAAYPAARQMALESKPFRRSGELAFAAGIGGIRPRATTGMLALLGALLLAGAGCGTTPKVSSAAAECQKDRESPVSVPGAQAVQVGLAGEYTNSLGMKLIPVPGTKVLFCIWETRVKDYSAYATANPGVDASWKDPVDEGVKVTPTDDCPVVEVSWGDARAFCQWLTEEERREGKLRPDQSYRLPTDAEWSVAVDLPEESGRTPKEKDETTKDVYPWGTQWPPPNRAGNYDDYSKFRIEGFSDGFARTAPVGSFAPNKHGLFDLGGNVWEWCEDRYDTDRELRGLRGGSWNLNAREFLLSSARFYLSPDYRDVGVGFRCVLEFGESVR
jgi:hypothetical protein